jgi:hypothetical protein
MMGRALWQGKNCHSGLREPGIGAAGAAAWIPGSPLRDASE